MKKIRKLNPINLSVLTKLIFILIVLVIILQIIHMILIYQLEQIKAQNYARLKNQEYDLKQMEIDEYRMIRKVRDSHVLDSSGYYHIIHNLFGNYVTQTSQLADYDQQLNNQDQDHDRSNDLTVVTQCSASRLYYIDDLLHSYKGPISLSIFTLSHDIPKLFNVLLLLRKCLSLFRKYVQVHLIYPITSDSFSIKLTNINSHNLSCSTLSHQLASLRRHKDEFRVYGEVEGLKYPVNLLRNVARNNADTSFILVLDIDLIPSKSLRNAFNNFIKRNKNTVKLDDKTVIPIDEQIAFVLPTYEMDLNLGNNLANIIQNDDDKEEKSDENVLKEVTNAKEPISENDQSEWSDNNSIRMRNRHLGINLGNLVGRNYFGTSTIPTNKSSLFRLIKRKLIRPFYYELCFKCHRLTNYDQWQSIKSDSQMNVLYEINWQDPYEPFYISRNVYSLPFYNENFKSYGFNRISQLCATHVVGYRFLVLNNHFLVHKGFKKPNQFHDSKDIELERNRLLFRQYKNELKIKYPHSPRRCY